MMTTPEQLIEAQKSNLEALLKQSQGSFEKIEQAVELNLNAMKSYMEDSCEAIKAMASAKDIQELVSITSSFSQPLAEKAVSYSKDVYTLTSGLVSEASRKFEAQVSESNKKFVELFESATKNAPAGSESAVAMMKSAMTAANSAYESINKATKQATEIAEANVDAATKATFKASNSASNAGAKPRKTSIVL